MSYFEFIIQAISVSCPSCNEVFATQTPFRMPEMTPTLPVEADLHRVLPYGAVRACSVSICPQCQYSWWTNTFNRHYFLPVGIAIAPAIDYAKKFAHAVLTGRKNNYHILDRALLALNGYWCAKESNQETKKWLVLAIQELSAAINNNSWQGNRSRYHYLLAELLRLNGQFGEAIQTFALVDSKSNLPQQLIDSQKNLASKQNSDTVLLSNKQVVEIFFPKLVNTLSETENQQTTKHSETIQSDSNTIASKASSENVANTLNPLPPKRLFKATA